MSTRVRRNAIRAGIFVGASFAAFVVMNVDESPLGETPQAQALSTASSRSVSSPFHTASRVIRPTQPKIDTAFEPYDPLLVAFAVRNDADFDTDSFRWSFGDGEHSTESNPVHRFKSGGRVEVQLAYVDSEGQSRIHSWPVTLNRPPSVSIQGGGVLTETFGMGLWFQASASDADPATQTSGLDLVWNFGDATPRPSVKAATSTPSACNPSEIIT